MFYSRSPKRAQLCEAAYALDVKAVKVCLANKQVDINATINIDHMAWTALGHALRTDGAREVELDPVNLPQRRLDVVRLLIDHKADPNIEGLDGEYESETGPAEIGAPLLLALECPHWPDLAKVLLDAGASPNYVVFRGNTLLLNAVRDGNVGLVDMLLEYRADVTLRNHAGLTAVLMPPGREGDITRHQECKDRILRSQQESKQVTRTCTHAHRNAHAHRSCSGSCQMRTRELQRLRWIM